ncbi:MAG: 2-methoxy-6-polyprenyl-1,4-benzoquinol methylase, mitochondrial [Chroococcopsis gigantea SAG 12.99]|nr:2-methoxy-6-polyprenyl-1,4-benzoquinol methylase, mitochondrial [Chroococcopsis gigantea SAG 12.99]
MNDKEEIFRGKERFFDIWAPNYDFLLTTVVYGAIHKRLLEYVNFNDSPQVLDLGCGTGKLLQRLAAKYPALRGIGLDLSSEMLRVARHNNRYRERLIHVAGNSENLNFVNRQFNAIFNTISFLHYPEPEIVLGEISRVLTPGGKYYLADSILPVRKITFSPGGLRLYSIGDRETMARRVGLRAIGHYYLLGSVVLSIFTK